MAVEYVTRSELRSLGSKLEESVFLAAERSPTKGTTFLSHSSKDEDLVRGVILVLTKHGASVYIDKKDPELPPTTSRETAEKLRSRIAESRKFVLLASSNSRTSTWVPWELGLADGHRSPSNVAIFPAVEHATDHRWTETEYLGIYNRVVWGSLRGYERPVWMVWNQESNVATELGKWLVSP